MQVYGMIASQADIRYMKAVEDFLWQDHIFLHLPPVMKYMLIRSAVSTVGRSKALSIIDITNE